MEKTRSVLKLIKDSDYGASNSCGNKIGAKRLVSLSLTVLCIDFTSEGST